MEFSHNALIIDYEEIPKYKHQIPKNYTYLEFGACLARQSVAAEGDLVLNFLSS